MDTSTTELRSLIERAQLTAEVEWADSNPNMDRLPAGSTHYLVKIHSGITDETIEVPFSQGPAHSGEPELASVLDCLASDAASYEDAGSFDEWASELGYFPIDSAEEYRHAEATYRVIEHQTEELGRLLARAHYETLLWDTERL